jgi:beta-xylosidase
MAVVRHARTRSRGATTLVLLCVAVVVGAGGFGVVSALPKASPGRRVPALPHLGPVQTVDQNDVGDPFVLPVPAGVTPPTDVPFVTTGHDAYQSAPLSAATSASAVSQGWYVLFGTTDWQSNVPTAVSTDLVHWTQAPDSLPVLPSWAAPSFTKTWAPAALRTNAGWVLYFSTEEARSKLECIGRAISSSPAGPYKDQSTSPLLCQPNLGGSIDPTVVHGQDGQEFLIWKNDGNADGSAVGIWSQQLTSDGLGVIGTPRRLIGVDAAWEHGIVEAPAMIAAKAGGYWLFYSGGEWNSNAYGTGLAYCSSATGPCVETSSTPFLATTASIVSPGGIDTFTDHRGRLWAAFTSLVLVPAPWRPGHDYYNRVLDIAPLSPP